jgi:flagellar hook-associated protein 2
MTIRPTTRLGGLATGFDTETMVRDLVRAHRIRVDRLTQNRTQLEWRRDDLRALNTQLTTLRNRTFDMTLQGAYRRFTVASSNEGVVTATATGNALAMTLEFSSVTRLAASARATSTGSIVMAPHTTIDANVPLAQLISAGQIDGAGLPETFDVTVFNHNQTGTRVSQTLTINTATDSVNSVLSRISSSQTLGLQAFYDTFSGRVSITSRFTGNNNPAAADMGFEGAGAAFFTTSLRLAVQDGQNAQFTLNGLATERPTNNFTINGVAFTLHNTLAVGATATVTVATDQNAVLRSLIEFVELYNTTLGQINTHLTAERHRDFLPLTDEQRQSMNETDIKRWEERARSGLLRGDDTLMRIVGRMRRDFAEPIAEGTLRQVSALGIQTVHHGEGGRLHINETRLRAELERDPSAVEDLFIQVARRLRTSLDVSVREINAQAGSPSGFTRADSSVIGQQMQRLNDRMAREEDRISRVEDRLWRQFTSLERAMERMNSQSAWLAQQFAPRQR